MPYVSSPAGDAALESDAVRITLVGGPTVVIDIAGRRLITDPTFDPAGPHAVGDRVLQKTTGPPWTRDALGPVDVVLLSHDQHPDNLDAAGRAVVASASLTLTTPDAARRLGGTAVGLPAWRHHDIEVPGRPALRVIGMPAQHGPAGTEAVTGDVIGFLIVGEKVPTIYVSGDNVSLEHVRAIADNNPAIDVAILFAGAARTALLDANLTLSARQAAEAAEILATSIVVVAHVDGWAHLREGPADVIAAFHASAARLAACRAGESIVIAETPDAAAISVKDRW